MQGLTPFLSTSFLAILTPNVFQVVVHEVCYGVDSNLCEGSQWFCQPCKFEFRRALEKSRALNPHASQNPEDVWRELRAPEVDPCGFLRPGVDCRICPGKVGAFKGSPATLADFGTSISGAALWAHVHCAQVRINCPL